MNINSKIIHDIITHYDYSNQIAKAIEELDELKEALIDDTSKEHILEEMADVHIMLEQLARIYGLMESDIEAYINYKLTRTKIRIMEESRER